ncbi:hypothetical protein G7046_g6796 [Stylonectria norvegica]|nr:hypothetical protein G7046_g6796 [Stylonectria norvegica]
MDDEKPNPSSNEAVRDASHETSSLDDSSTTPSLHHGTNTNTPSITSVSSSDSSDTLDSSPPPPPNGGYGWVCTACVGLINAHTWGLNSAYGVFLAYYLSHDVFPGGTHLDYAFIGALSLTCTMLVSPLATVCVHEFGTKPTLFLGTVLQAASLVAASFATKIWHLFLTQGVLFGVGMGFIFVTSSAIVPQWFTTRRSLANGIAACGSGLGGVVYSFAAGAMIKHLGLAWAFRILGILAFVANTISTLLIKDRNSIIGSRQSAFETDLLRRPEYLLLLGFGWFSMLGYVVLIYSLSNYANEIGLDASQAALISGIFNLGQTFGRPLMGYFSDRTGRINMACLTTFLTGIFVFTIWINAKTYAVLIVFAVVGGAVGGTFWATIAPVTAEVVGLKYVPSGLNIMWLTILLPCTFSEPIALQIVIGTGKYTGAQIFTGFMYIAAALCLVGLRGWKIGEISEIARVTNQDPESIDPVKAENENDEVVSIKSRRVGRRRMLHECWRWGVV